MPATLSRTAQQNGTQRATKRCQQKQDPSLPYTLAQLSKPKIGHLWPPARSRIHRHQALISPQRFADPDLCRVPDFGSTFGLQELRSPLNEDVQALTVEQRNTKESMKTQTDKQPMITRDLQQSGELRYFLNLLFTRLPSANDNHTL
ncbi:LYR motif-containing protein 9 isoform X3 [Hypanus sabinus]|uniref:LYR motif-containing protein 9 isoform X3 n=1 Tax=Hypanus sabinus TaxID=79690 RepID=UPI0028C41543|nr:LYR motif-containing protein 9 isoform X3 [Hypanus sabinus]